MTLTLHDGTEETFAHTSFVAQGRDDAPELADRAVTSGQNDVLTPDLVDPAFAAGTRLEGGEVFDLAQAERAFADGTIQKVLLAGIGGPVLSLAASRDHLLFDPGDAFDYLNVGEIATQSFDVTVRDPGGQSDALRYSVTLEGVDDPIIGGGASGVGKMTFTEGVVATGSLFVNFGQGRTRDPEGEALRLRALRLDGVAILTGVPFDLGCITMTVGADGRFTFDPGSGFDALAEGVFADLPGFDIDVDTGEGTALTTVSFADFTLRVEGLGSVTETSDTAEAITLLPGPTTVTGSLASLDADTIDGFDLDDTLLLTEPLQRDQITVTQGSAILDFDSDGDGQSDAQVVRTGDFSDGDFLTSIRNGATHIRFAEFLPDLVPGRGLPAGQVNGIVDQDILTGDGSMDFTIEIANFGLASYRNALCVYEVTPDGQITEARILFGNGNATGVQSTVIEDVAAGNLLGFFPVQNAADWVAALADTDELPFVTQTGHPATDSSGVAHLAVNGELADMIVFHALAAGWNSDGLVHSVSGVAPGGRGADGRVRGSSVRW